jgi:hypothetical protein
MQVSVSLVDWALLRSLTSPRGRVDALHDGEGGAFREGDSEIDEDWSDSAVLHQEACDALEKFCKEWPRDSRVALLTTGFTPLVSNAPTDELGLADVSSGCFYASLSPTTVATMAEALTELDLAWVAAEIGPPRCPGYLDQWAAVIFLARDRGMGLVAHVG